MGSMFAWSLAQNTCGNSWNFVMLLVLDFIPLYQIANMSLNGLRRQVKTHDKTLIGPHIDEPLVALDLWH